MFTRIIAIICLLSIWYGAAMQMIEKRDEPLLVQVNPLQRAQELADEGRMEEVLLLTRFSQQYLPVDAEYSTTALSERAQNSLDSSWFFAEQFISGALTGEVMSTPGLLGALVLDMLVVGDIRDLLVQGYREYDSGEGDEVIIGLSTAGLLLTLAPELSWAPSVFKNFWRGRRFSEPLRRQIKDTVIKAQKTGDYRPLRKLVAEFSDVVHSLGSGPSMAVFKHVETTNDLTRLSSKAKAAPAETYTLVSLEGIRSLENISPSVTKHGKLIKSVKIATRQQKFFTKTLGLIPTMGWLLIILIATALLIVLLRRAKS